jgi:ABC-type polysaccharide/polyol phosphate export permease
MSSSLQNETGSAAPQDLRPDQPLSNVEDRKGLVSLWVHRHLLGLMVKRDNMGKYKGSLLGLLWPLINPHWPFASLYVSLFNCLKSQVWNQRKHK